MIENLPVQTALRSADQKMGQETVYKPNRHHSIRHQRRRYLSEEKQVQNYYLNQQTTQDQSDR